MDLSNVVELGDRMERPRTISVRLLPDDLEKIEDYCRAVCCSRETFVRGIILTFLTQFGDLMARTAAEQEQSLTMRCRNES